MDDQLHLNQETVYQVPHGDLRTIRIGMKFVPHSLMFETTETSHNLWRLYTDLSDGSTVCFSVYLWWPVLGVSVRYWNRISGNGVKDKIIAEAQKCCRVNSMIQTTFLTYLKNEKTGYDPQRICAWGKNSEQRIVRIGAVNVMEEYFERGRKLERNETSTLFRTVPLFILSCSENFPRRGGNFTRLIHSTLRQPTFFCLLKWKSSTEKEEFTMC